MLFFSNLSALLKASLKAPLLSVFLFSLLTLSSQIVFASEDTSYPTIRWAYFEDGEPESWQENGIPRGMQVEITDYIFEQLGINVTYEFYPWARAQQMVRTGEVDGMVATPVSSRFEYAVFGKEAVQVFYWNVLIKKGNTAIEQAAENFRRLEDLKGYQLVDFFGNGWQSHFMKIEDGYYIQQVEKLSQIPLMLTTGRCDLILNSSNWIYWWAQKQGVKDQIQELTVRLPNTRFHLVFMVSRNSPWNDRGLIRAMDEELRKMKASGEWHRILRNYLHPHGFGRPFESDLTTDHYYVDYDSYPVFGTQ